MPEERKYALTKIDLGDYIFPGNNGVKVWRLKKYVEDGSLQQKLGNGSWRSITGEFWAAYKFRGTAQALEADPLAVDEWDRWDMWESGYPTRRDAAKDVCWR